MPLLYELIVLNQLLVVQLQSKAFFLSEVDTRAPMFPKLRLADVKLLKLIREVFVYIALNTSVAVQSCKDCFFFFNITGGRDCHQGHQHRFARFVQLKLNVSILCYVEELI